MRAILFRTILFFIDMLVIGFWVEIHAFDALMFSLTMTLSLILIADVISLFNDYKNTYHKNCGFITNYFYKK